MGRRTVLLLLSVASKVRCDDTEYRERGYFY